MELPTKERSMEILNLYKAGKRDLFNWCEEYKNFVYDSVSCCVSSEWDYMIKKSFEDRESPCNYEDLDLFSKDKFMESIEYEFNRLDEEEKKECIKELNEDCKTWEEVKDWLIDKDKDELINTVDSTSWLSHISVEDAQSEVYEWWIIQDPLKYRLEKQGEIFLNGAWGRQGTGQSISLDYEVMKAFITILEERII